MTEIQITQLILGGMFFGGIFAGVCLLYKGIQNKNARIRNFCRAISGAMNKISEFLE